MKQICLALCLTALASQAVALSCVRPDPISTFQQVAQAPEDYYVLYGTLTFDEAELPDSVSKDPSGADLAPIPAFFRGKGLTRNGFTSDYISPTLLQVTCAGPWCGSAQSGVEAIFFVQAAEPPVTMVAGPCGGRIFENPSSRMLEALVSCMNGKACSAQPFQQ